VDVILPDTEIQLCRRDGRSDFLGDFFAFDGELRKSSSSDAAGEGATSTSTIRLLKETTQRRLDECGEHQASGY